MAKGREKLKRQGGLKAKDGATAYDAQEARDAIRQTQRLASQLHQLIAASITVGGLREDREILASLAGSARRVFDADLAVLSLHSGPRAPLRGVARRGAPALCLSAGEIDGDDDVPALRSSFVPWRDGDWLVAPVLERRDEARGVLGVRRAGGEFVDEDREVLTLLAQMAATALGASELSREIQSSEARLRTLVDTAPAGIVEVDVAGHVQWWNRAASTIFSWPAHDDDAVEARFPDGVSDELTTLWHEVLDDKGASGRDLIGVEINARRRDLTVSAALLPSPKTSDKSILMLVDDVTDHRQLKAEVQHAQQMETRGRVASSVAHDFNNLLTLISGYAEILSKDHDIDARSLDMVKDIQSTASRASLLTAQLQTIGRTQTIDPVVLDPVAVVESNAEVFERILGSEVEVSWELDANAGTIRVDAGQFEQMMLNLAINARDAMAEGGRLRVAIQARTLEHSDDATTSLRAGDYVAITVTDSGVGMDEETRRHCFDPFFTTKGPFKGTGLGLAAARRLVEESGGTIACHSELGLGTTFEILLPTNHDAVVDEPVAPINERPRGSATVLVSEDDESLRRLMVQVLTRNGYRVLVAASGEHALEVVGEHEGDIDLLVSDVVMGDLSGPQLAATLQHENPQLRVLLTSGTADARVLDDLRPGTAAFLAKPFRPSALIDGVHDLLSRR